MGSGTHKAVLEVLDEQIKNDLAGILPIAKSSLSQWGAWILPGHGESREDCGQCRIMGCLETQNHHGDHEGQAYWKAEGRSCRRAECPVCYEKWASAEGHRAVRRMMQYKTRMKPIHVIMSPSVGDFELSYDELKEKMYSVAKEIGVIGGLSIIHPWRSICKLCQNDKDFCECGEAQVLEWYLSPHFHLVCYGWVKGEIVGSMYEREGWIVKNLGVRQSMAATIAYQLSHAGVSKPRKDKCPVHGDDKESCELEMILSVHKGGKTRETKKATVTWFGDLSYNRLKVDKEIMSEKPKCPLCEAELHEIVFTAYQIEYDQVFERGKEYFGDVFGWEYLKPPPSPYLGKIAPVGFEDMKTFDA